ncbi:cytochrome C oxidase subunit IV family protein [Nocardia nova]|uniref:cytochrome C oxidase subunit IV family protein n=1 Tax=Nocardia nova TaxID=37330 RepID=UPI001893A96B|nr:cytochrome C oxidase subunit IV family protein [Nocardia nova]MBF6149559.1 cytochrome C oxidase subunit IV family protein [Nocardia nova]
MSTLEIPRRATWVWIGLVAATCVTWWFGADHPLAAISVKFATGGAVAIAFAKAYFIGSEFMELRSAPVILRRAFAGWVTVVGGAAIVLSIC